MGTNNYVQVLTGQYIVLLEKQDIAFKTKAAQELIRQC